MSILSILCSDLQAERPSSLRLRERKKRNPQPRSRTVTPTGTPIRVVSLRVTRPGFRVEVVSEVDEEAAEVVAEEVVSRVEVRVLSCPPD